MLRFKPLIIHGGSVDRVAVSRSFQRLVGIDPPLGSEP
jgi:hypothetical protein